MHAQARDRLTAREGGPRRLVVVKAIGDLRSSVDSRYATTATVDHARSLEETDAVWREVETNLRMGTRGKKRRGRAA